MGQRVVTKVARPKQVARRTSVARRRTPVAVQGELQLVPPTWGGRRVGAGRKRKPGQHDSPHRARPVLLGRYPVHTVLRTLPAVGRLRRRVVYQAVRRALVTIGVDGGFRVVHMSIQHNHLHLLVEATDQRVLSRGMQRLAILVARAINRSLGRRGKVFAHRYHRTDITTPKQARHALAYVLNNWRRHREDQEPAARAHRVDPYSTAFQFDGWADSTTITRLRSEAMLPSAPPRTWLLRFGWRVHGAIASTEVPGPAAPGRAMRGGGARGEDAKR